MFYDIHKKIDDPKQQTLFKRDYVLVNWIFVKMDSIKLYTEMLVIKKKNHTVLLTSNEEITINCGKFWKR